MTVPCSRIRRRFGSASTIPPPVAITRPFSRQTSSSTSDSRRRNPSSPSISNTVATGTPVLSTRRRSVSTNSRFMRAASARPTVVLPAPIMPTRKMLEWPIGSIVPRARIAKKKPGLRRALQGWAPSADGERVLHDLRRHEDQQLGLVVLLDGALEEVADDRQVAQERHLVHGGAGGLLEDAAQNDRVAVVDQDLRRHALRVDGGHRAAGRVDQLSQ